KSLIRSRTRARHPRAQGADISASYSLGSPNAPSAPAGGGPLVPAPLVTTARAIRARRGRTSARAVSSAWSQRHPRAQGADAPLRLCGGIDDAPSAPAGGGQLLARYAPSRRGAIRARRGRTGRVFSRR